MILLLSWGFTAQAEEQSLDEGPPPTSVDESVTSMDTAFSKTPEYGKKPTTLKEKLKNTDPFFRDTKLNINLRTFYFYRDKYDSSKSEAWALGGSISYQSGYFLDHLAVGSTFYTSQPLYAPADRDGTTLLKSGQDGYSTFGQLFAEIKLVDDVFINVYRKEYNTPYINKNDNRMTPNTFEAYTLLGTYGGKDGAPSLRYGIGYFTKMKPRNEEGFDWMSRAAGAKVDRGVFAAGANYKQKDLSFGAVNYYCNDVINIFYAEGKYSRSVTDRIGLMIAAQYTDQRSAGSNLLTGSSFFSNQVGIKGEADLDKALLLTLAYTTDASGDNLRNPWSSYPGYTSVQVQDFNRAGEEAFMIRLSYDFTRIGLEGLTASALWVHGWNRVDPVTDKSVKNEDEYDVDIQWRAKDGLLKGLWPRFRYGRVEQRGSSQYIEDLRMIVNYEISAL